MFGDNGVDSAPYMVLSADKDQNIELRKYEPMILVSTSMSSDSGNSAFRKLFKYISGANQGTTEIAMTAPVIMGKESSQEGSEIAMTAPVFMNDSAGKQMMSFVMPKNFTLETTPKPTDPDVTVSELNNYKVVAIKFNWTLSDSNVEKHIKILQKWMADNNYEATGKPVKAGYNSPLTLPWFRHNEVLIEVE
jgi:hypothetical protein